MYLLPDPPLFAGPEEQQQRQSQNEIRDFAHTYESETGVPPSSTPATTLLLQGQSVMLANDLNVGERLKATLGALVTSAGATCVQNIDEADILVARWRQGPDFETALAHGLIIGNVSWLFWMFARGTYVSPCQHLLHYPLIPHGLEEMRDMIITVTNYTGHARAYLEQLIVASGATFTKTLRPTNTHLIAATPTGDKYDAAQEWNIPTVNHLWLEESYAQMTLQAATKTRYTHFLPSDNMETLICTTDVDETVIRRALDITFQPVNRERTSGGKVHEESGKSGAESGESEARVNDRTESGVRGGKRAGGCVDLTSEAGDQPSPTSTHTSAGSYAPGGGGGGGGAAADARELHTPTRAVTPLSSRSSSKRKAAASATYALHNHIMPDVLLHEREKRRRAHSDTATRSRSPHDSSARALVTGYDTELSANQVRLLEEQGVSVTDDPSQCTHLVAPRVLRTEKFLAALPYGPVVVTRDWLDHVVRRGPVAETGPYALRDTEAELRWQFTLGDTLARARARQASGARGLLAGYAVCYMKHVWSQQTRDTLRRIAEHNGSPDVRFAAAGSGTASGPAASAEVTAVIAVTPPADGGGRRPANVSKAARKAVHAPPQCPVVAMTLDMLVQAVLRQEIPSDK